MAALRLAFIFCAAVGLLAPAASALDGQQPPGGVLFVKQILKLFQKENIESMETTSSPSPTRLAESTAAAISEKPASTKLSMGPSKPAETAAQEKLRVPAKKPYKSRFTKESAPSKASTLAATTIASNAPTSKLCTVDLSGDNEWTCLAEQKCGVALQTTSNDLSALCLAGSTGGEPDCWASECALGEECRLPGESFICACKSSDCKPAVKQLIELSEGTRQPLNPTGTFKPNAPAAAQAKNGTTATHWVLLCLIVLLMLAIVAVVVCLLCGCIC